MLATSNAVKKISFISSSLFDLVFVVIAGSSRLDCGNLYLNFFVFSNDTDFDCDTVDFELAQFSLKFPLVGVKFCIKLFLS